MTVASAFAARLVLCLGLLAGGVFTPVAGAQSAAAGAGSVAANTDPALEARVMKLSAELRCLVCQNQTIADSNADLAVDLRNQVRSMLQDGRSDREVMGYMTDRYGDFVLYRPPLKSSTALLWFGPLLLLGIGAAVMFVVVRRRSRLPAERFEPDPDLEADPLRTSGREGTVPRPPAPHP